MVARPCSLLVCPGPFTLLLQVTYYCCCNHLALIPSPTCWFTTHGLHNQLGTPAIDTVHSQPTPPRPGAYPSPGNKRERPSTPGGGSALPEPPSKRWLSISGWDYQSWRRDGRPGLPKAPHTAIDQRRGPGRCWWRGCTATDHTSYFECPWYWDAMSSYKGVNYLEGLDPADYNVRGFHK